MVRFHRNLSVSELRNEIMSLFRPTPSWLFSKTVFSIKNKALYRFAMSHFKLVHCT